MSQRTVRTFFYGSYMNRAVLREVDISPERMEVARLDGWEVSIRPLTNLVPAEGAVAWGLVADVTHAELERLYAHARDVLGGAYLPEAVLVETRDGRRLPALCYVSTTLADAPPDPAYVERVAGPAREHGFPARYVARLEAFAGDARGPQ